MSGAKLYFEKIPVDTVVRLLKNTSQLKKIAASPVVNKSKIKSPARRGTRRNVK